MGAATLPPWLSPWSSGLVFAPRGYKPRQGARLRAERPHPRLTIFTYGHTNNAPLLRFGSWAEEGGASPPPGAGPAPPPPGGMHWERVPLDRPPWHLEVPVPDRAVPPYDITSHSDADMFPEEGGDPDGGDGGGSATLAAAAHAYGGAVRGWAAGAALLALLVLLVRVAERLLDWKIVLRRRRLHRERQRARVNAAASAAHVGGPPPPYSACIRPGVAVGVAVGAADGTKAGESPPPPYCSVRGGSGKPPFAPASAPAPAPHRIARVLQACGMRLRRGDARPPPAVLSSGFGVITYYAMDWTTESLIARQQDAAPAPGDPPPLYSSAGADATDARGSAPRCEDAAPTDGDADPSGAVDDAVAQKDVYIDV